MSKCSEYEMQAFYILELFSFIIRIYLIIVNIFNILHKLIIYKKNIGMCYCVQLLQTENVIFALRKIIFSILYIQLFFNF